ncbi:MAG: hypothetical protein JWN05_702, partial [Arthrobacter sp.]|nr:hypothetical protein [Arthrobacter sp.]
GASARLLSFSVVLWTVVAAMRTFKSGTRSQPVKGGNPFGRVHSRQQTPLQPNGRPQSTLRKEPFDGYLTLRTVP